jgi:sec-independent protein translocase protein TatB
MSALELLLILFVAILVFGPNKLPMLARHLGLLLRKMNQLQMQVLEFWREQQKALQLQDNERAAEKADKTYSQDG